MKLFKFKIYMHYFFDDFIFIYPYYSIMFTDNNITSFELSILMIIWSVAVLLFEIPSGTIADRFNRKYVVVIGELIRIIGYLFWIFMPSFIGYAIGFIFWAIKSAFRSGAIEALIYENLKHEKCENEYALVMGRAKVFSLMGILSATLIASFLYKYGYDVLVYLGSLSLLFSIISIIDIKDIRGSNNDQNEESLIKYSLRFIVSNPYIIFLMLLSSILLITGVLDEFYGVYAVERGFPHINIGILITVLTLIEIVFLNFVKHFMNWKNKYIVYSIIVVGLALSITSKVNLMISFLLLGITNGLFKALNVVIDYKFQNAYKGEFRSTITSYKGFLNESAAILYYLVIGLLSVNNTYNKVFLNVGFITIGIGVLMSLFVIIKGKYKINDQ